MGPIEHAVHLISQIVQKKYKDEKLAEQIRGVASNCNDAGQAGKDGFSVNHPQNKAITKITKIWIKEYKDYDIW